MKRAIIVHCWEGYPEYCWYPYAKSELEKKNFEVKVPAFPDTENPKENAWVAFLKQEIGTPDEDLYLIGHSIGATTILRYLETIDESEKIGGVVLVAGFTEKIGYKEIENFFKSPFNLEKIKRASKNGFTAIHSDNDPYVNVKFADIFKEKLGAEIIIKNSMGHFSGDIENEKACLELPEVVESVLKLANK